ncbi:MAG: phosphatase PAP2 family protein [Actinomycetota bacterium]
MPNVGLNHDARVTDQTDVPQGKKLVAVVAFLFFSAWLISLGIHSKTGISYVDQSVWQFFVDHGSTRVHSLARSITSFGVLSFLGPLCVVLGACLWVKTRSVAVAVAPWISVMVCGEIVSTLKKSTNIARPPLQYQIAQIHNPSFPSGHAADTTAFIVSLLFIVWCALDIPRHVKTWASVVGVSVFVAMGLTRLVLNVHWLSDVLAGWCIGAAIGIAVTGLLMARRPQKLSTQ